ncbi:hypothetical protein CKAH01_00735 [Colletotrichum kahawae]|uniref:Uncharacterized protein n=1 Tax=Colletotrichum kahawae TaxID=34407 RepID=A0AAD9YJK5_COLKA|nr:hypothetical protein CKAH01_00735 [Colletotrichum kahawae]
MQRPPLNGSPSRTRDGQGCKTYVPSLRRHFFALPLFAARAHSARAPQRPGGATNEGWGPQTRGHTPSSLKDPSHLHIKSIGQMTDSTWQICLLFSLVWNGPAAWGETTCSDNPSVSSIGPKHRALDFQVSLSPRCCGWMPERTLVCLASYLGTGPIFQCNPSPRYLSPKTTSIVLGCSCRLALGSSQLSH